jgi:hypothetical protein
MTSPISRRNALNHGRDGAVPHRLRRVDLRDQVGVQPVEEGGSSPSQIASPIAASATERSATLVSRMIR